MSRAVIGAGEEPSGLDSRTEDKYSPSLQLLKKICIKVKKMKLG
jgi:hypothetical protein